MFVGSKYAETERIYFRCWEERNFSDAVKLWGNHEVTGLIGGPFSEEQVKKRFENEIDTYNQGQVQYWPFYLKKNSSEEEESGDRNRELVGCCGLRPYRVEEQVYELGFHLLPQYWGHGYAQEAAKAVIDFAFYGLKVRALFAGHNPLNISSKRLLEKLGFQFSHEEFYPLTGLNHPSYFLREP